MLPASSTTFIVCLIVLLVVNNFQTPPSPPTNLRFELRHLHAVSPSAHVVFQDVPSLPKSFSRQQLENRTFSVGTRQISTQRGPDFDSLWQARVHSMKFGQSQRLNWEEVIIPGPDVESRETLLQLAKMSNNAYLTPEEPEWYDLGGGWNNVCTLGRFQSD